MITKRTILLVGLIVFSLFSSACAGTSPEEITESQAGPTVDPVFRAFYNYLGGEQLLGSPISEPFQEGPATVQFVHTGKLVFDPTAPATSKFRLAPLGVEMNLSEPPNPPSTNPELHYLGGHTILPDFYPLYEKLGPLMVGLPLTEARHNWVHKRWEQYFENLGLFRLDGTQEVRLLAYGAWACAQDCMMYATGSLNAIPGATDTRGTAIDVLGGDAVDAVFQDYYLLQGSDFTGFPLDLAYSAADGKWEQILENVVLVTDSSAQPGSVGLRPLSELLNILPEPPRPYSGDPNMIFLPSADPALGYEIPTFFWDYIGQRGGLNVFGAPITHYALFNGSAYHQCFQNLCLAFDPGATEATRIRPEPLGYAYKYLYGGAGVQPTAIPTLAIVPILPTVAPTIEPTVEPQLLPSPTLSPTAIPTAPLLAVREITLQVLVRFKVVETQEAQEIGVRVLENNMPMVGALVDLTVAMPDGTQQIFSMPVTDPNGYSSIMLPVIAAPPSTVIPYKVCYASAPDMRVCITDSFVIWNTP